MTLITLVSGLTLNNIQITAIDQGFITVYEPNAKKTISFPNHMISSIMWDKQEIPWEIPDDDL